MILLDIGSVLIIFIVAAVIMWTMVKLLNGLEAVGLHYVPAAWITTAWGVTAILASSTFLISILRYLLGYK